MRTSFRWILAATICVLAGCTDATSYHRADMILHQDGFEEKQQSPVIWHVVFNANSLTSHETIQTYWLYHSAELTLAQGFDGFEYLSRSNLSQGDSGPDEPVRLAASAPVVIFIPGGGGDSGIPYHFGADIQLLHRPFRPVAGRVFDAADLKQRLDAYVNGLKCEHGNICPHDHDYLRLGDEP